MTIVFFPIKVRYLDLIFLPMNISRYVPHIEPSRKDKGFANSIPDIFVALNTNGYATTINEQIRAKKTDGSKRKRMDRYPMHNSRQYVIA